MRPLRFALSEERLLLPGAYALRKKRSCAYGPRGIGSAWRWKILLQATEAGRVAVMTVLAIRGTYANDRLGRVDDVILSLGVHRDFPRGPLCR